MYGDAGVGKTTAAFELPSPYIIDSEQGTNHYSEQIEKAGGVVFQTTLMSEVMDEVRSLRTEKHDYKTLVIDAITPLYFDLAERMEMKVGSDFGRHIAEANKHMRKLVNMLMELDMNVIMTAHSKVQYGDDMKKLGVTFDGWKRLDFIFDLVLELRKISPTKRKAKVVKSRLPNFPDGEVFDWTYNALSERANVEELQREAVAIKVATKEQIEQITKIAGNMQDGDDFVQNCIDKAKVEFLSDMPRDKADKMLVAMRKKIGASE